MTLVLEHQVYARIMKLLKLFGYNRQSQTLREERRLRVLENRVLRKIF